MKSAVSTIAPGVLFGLFLSVFAEDEVPRVKAQVGLIEGYYKTSNSGRRYEAYEGIPYAEPPVDELRFEPPKNRTIFAGNKPALIAKTVGADCLQFDESQNKLHGSEDCLYLNIYRPKRISENDALLPVIFYIHGDDFQSGSGREHGPKYLLDRDVILITFNYRLGPLGFLSTEDDVVPGNMGLKDQALALDWVARNIPDFRGDSDNIAIIGHGAGGASVHYHYLSKQIKKLFHKGMSLSGTALAPWAQAKESLKRAKKLAEIVGCPTEAIPDMVNCMKKQPADYIVQTIGTFRAYMKSPIAPFGPVVEKGSQLPTTFINESPVDIIVSGRAYDVPWITGVVGAEGLAVAAGIVADENELSKLEAEWEEIAPYVLEFTDTVPPSSYENVSRLIKEHYLADAAFAPWSTVATLHIFGDRLFTCNAAQAALLQAHSVKSPIRFYRFLHRGANSFSQNATGNNEVYGAAHKDDLAYVFELPVDMTTTEGDRSVQKVMLDLWVSFAADKMSSEAKLGIEWPNIKENSNEIKILDVLRPNEIAIRSSMELGMLGETTFWESLGLAENIPR